MTRLPARRRSFADFRATPRGVAYLQAGYYDRTIKTYMDTFGTGNVMVLRFEDIGRAPQQFMSRLCRYLGIAEQPLPEGRANEGSTAQVARVRRSLPFIDQLPASMRRIGKTLLSIAPAGSETLLSETEISTLREQYVDSNKQTEKLLKQLTY
jgi:hypothetical protein